MTFLFIFLHPSWSVFMDLYAKNKNNTFKVVFFFILHISLFSIHCWDQGHTTCCLQPCILFLINAQEWCVAFSVLICILTENWLWDEEQAGKYLYSYLRSAEIYRISSLSIDEITVVQFCLNLTVAINLIHKKICFFLMTTQHKPNAINAIGTWQKGCVKFQKFQQVCSKSHTKYFIFWVCHAVRSMWKWSVLFAYSERLKNCGNVEWWTFHTPNKCYLGDIVGVA